MITKEQIINPEWEHAQFVSIAELNECEQKLEAANESFKKLNIHALNLVDRIRHLESALRRIADQDYRGNRSTESQIAEEALKP